MTQCSRPHHPASTSQVAVLALFAQGEYGAITQLAREDGLRRQEVHALRERAWEPLDAEFAPGAPELPRGLTLNLQPPDIKRAVVALRMASSAYIRDIVGVLPGLCGVHRSCGKVWNMLHEAEQCAANELEQVELSGIEHVAVDEMFSQLRPVLAGIDLDAQHLFFARGSRGPVGQDRGTEPQQAPR